MRAEGKNRRLVAYETPNSAVAEAYRTLRTNIQFASVTQDIKLLMVTSAGEGEGKSTTVSNLAVVMAQAGKRVLLVDCDLRKPTVHRTFFLENRIGLTNLLINQATIEDAVQETMQPGLSVVTSGAMPPNPAELLGSRRMRDLLANFGEHYDMVLVDSAPLLAVTDASLLANFVDGVLLVLRSGKVSRDDAKKAKAMLNHVGANLVGVVLNNKKVTSRRQVFGYEADEE